MPEIALLTPAQMRRVAPHFPRSRGMPRVDNGRVLSGIIYVLRHGTLIQTRASHKSFQPMPGADCRIPIASGNSYSYKTA